VVVAFASFVILPATVFAQDIRVGALSETITVTGESPGR
jgi:hypothetical protein